MSLFVILALVYILKRNQFSLSSDRVRNAVYPLKYAFVPYLVIFVYSLIVIFIKHYGTKNIYRCIGSSGSAMILTIICASLMYLYGEESIDIFCNGLILEYIAVTMIGISKVGIGGLVEHIINPLNTYEKIFEKHATGFALFLFLIIYFIDSPKKHRRKIILIIFLEYLILKRVAVIGVVFAFFVYIITDVILKKKGMFKYKVVFWGLFVLAVGYVFFTNSVEFQLLTYQLGILNRSLFVNALDEFYSITPGFWGNGYGFVSVVIPNMNIAGVLGIEALHNDILKDFIELGFWGFILLYFYFFVRIPHKYCQDGHEKIVATVMALLCYTLVTLSTDNPFDYTSYMGALIVILTSLKIKSDNTVKYSVEN